LAQLLRLTKITPSVYTYDAKCQSHLLDHTFVKLQTSLTTIPNETHYCIKAIGNCDKQTGKGWQELRDRSNYTTLAISKDCGSRADMENNHQVGEIEPIRMKGVYMDWQEEPKLTNMKALVTGHLDTKSVDILQSEFHHDGACKTFAESKGCEKKHGLKDHPKGGKIELVLVHKCYGELYEELNSMKIKSDIAKIVKFILRYSLYQNIEVSKANVVRSFISQHKVGLYDWYVHQPYAKKCKSKMGRFTKGETEMIQENWARLIAINNIHKPDELLEGLENIPLLNTSILERKLRCVVGIYLSQGLGRERHYADVFTYAIQILKTQNKGPFTPEEDRIIIEEIKKNGDLPSTWKEICLMLKRNVKFYCNIHNRYKNVLSVSKKSGSWAFEEDKLLLEHLFQGCGILSIDKVKSIKSEDFNNIKHINRPLKNISEHWSERIKPILLSYHCGTLRTYSRRKFLSYIMKTGIEYTQDINWEEVLKHFPCETRRSLDSSLRPIRSNKEDTLSVAIEKYLENTSNNRKGKDEYTPKEKKYRDQIVSCYLSILKV